MVKIRKQGGGTGAGNLPRFHRRSMDTPPRAGNGGAGVRSADPHDPDGMIQMA